MMKLLPLEQEQQWIPQRLVPSLPSQFLLWTFLQRKVFALVDGKRTITQIAQLLSISPFKATKTLRELQDMGMIMDETNSGPSTT